MTAVIIGIILLIIVLVVFWYINTRNNFKRTQIKIDESLSGIEVALTKRYDVLTKLLDVTKGYMKHEQETFAQVIEMRKGMNVGEMKKAASQMNDVASQIQVAAEAYPELRSAELFVQLQKSVFDTEEHLQAARRLYNSNVTRFNTMKELFPISIIGKKYDKYEFFEAEAHKRADVEMKFN